MILKKFLRQNLLTYGLNNPSIQTFTVLKGIFGLKVLCSLF